MQDGEILKKIGSAVRFYRGERGLSQERLSELCGIDRSFIGNVERGEVNVSILTLCDILRGLDVSLKDIILKSYET